MAAGVVPKDDSYLLFVALAAYLVLVHVMLLYFVGSRLAVRVRAWVSRWPIAADAATRCMLVASIDATTVDGLRAELRSHGLRTAGLRTDLETRLRQWQDEVSG